MIIKVFGYEIQQWVVAYLVLLIPLIISWYWGLGLHKSIFTSSLRAMVQLLFMALLLVPVFAGGLWMQILLVVVMIVVGAFIARERGQGLPGVFWISLLCITLAYGIGMSIFVISGALELKAIIIIPISGMFIGMATRTIAQIYHKIQSDFEVYREAMEAMLIDGADWTAAVKMAQAETIHNALVPAIDSLKTLGIVHIPGAMAGLMIGGVDPIEAAGYQILIMFGMVANGAIGSLLANKMAYRVLFNRHYPHLKT